jgi:hypothetical protein
MPRAVYYTALGATDSISTTEIPQNDTVENTQSVDQQAIATISELKKDLKRLSNKRAIYIAARMSGLSQDENLRDLEGKLAKIEDDIMKRKSAYQKGDELISSSTGDTGSRSKKNVSLQSLITSLELERSGLKEKVWKIQNQVQPIHLSLLVLYDPMMLSTLWGRH